MCELLGAALDAAVARVLSIPHKVELRPTNPPQIACVWLLKEGKPDYRPGPYQPSVEARIAMALQTEHDISVVPTYGSPAGKEWSAGFCISFDDLDGITLEHEGQGPTPAIAICRAIVRRAEDAGREAEVLAFDQAETARRETIRGVAWDRATQARQTRKPWTEFASDEEQRAYALCMDQQLAFIRDLNAKGLA